MINCKYELRRKGLTLISLLIVILVIGILATMMILSSTESVNTAKAARIIANLQTMKRAVVAWYADNRDKVVWADGNSKVAGMVQIGNKASPVQEWGEDVIQLGKYISLAGNSDINIHYKKEHDNKTNTYNTNLMEGCYGVCDGGTVKNDSGDTTAYHRSQWYVGYRFKKGEEAIREKVRGMMNTAGVRIGTADAHIDTEDNDEKQNAAVWMRVF